MPFSEEKPTGVQPKQRWLRSLSRPKVQSSEPRAAAPDAEEHRDSRAGPGAQAAAAESRAAAPHGPRARGRALLRSLRRGCRAILSTVAAVIRQPGTQRPRHRAAGSATAAAAPAAGAPCRAAAPHCPCRAPGPSPGQLEAAGAQGPGAELGAVLPAADIEEQPFPKLEEHCLLQRLPGENSSRQRQSSEEERPPRPLTQRAWEEHWKLHPCPEQSPVEPRRSRPKTTTPAGPYPLERCRTPSPSLDQLQELELCGARSAVMALLEELGNKEQHWSTACEGSVSGEESLSQSGSNDPNKPESDSGPGQLQKLFLQDTDPSVSHGGSRKAQKLWLRKSKDVTIRTIWVNPLCPALMQEPSSLQAEEADSDLPSTSPAPGDPRHTRPGQRLKLVHQDTDPSVSHGEDSRAQELWQKKNKDVTIHTIWVNPLYPALKQEPGSLEAEEADSDLPSTSPAPGAPRHTQPAAAALARAPEDEEQHMCAPAQAQGVAKTAASAPSGVQGAAAESRAAAPHSPYRPPCPVPSPLEDLGPRAGPAAMALRAERRGEEGSSCEELSSCPSTEQAEDRGLSKSAEEESSSGSLQSEPLPEDTVPGRVAWEESSSESLQSEPLPEDTVPGRVAWEESSSESLQSEPLPEDTEPGRVAWEESSSESLQSEPLPEDTEPCRVAREEIGLMSPTHKAWVEDQDLSQGRQMESMSWSLSWLLEEEDQDVDQRSENVTASEFLLCESQAESWDTKVCTATQDGVDQPQEALICPYHTKALLLHRGTGTQADEQSLSQVEDAGRHFRELVAAMGSTWQEEELLRRARCTFERVQGLRSAAAVPVRQPSHSRSALRALLRAVRSLKRLIPGLHS